MEGYGKTGKDVKCPVMHGSMTNTNYGMANRDWWPKQLDLTILHQHDKNQTRWVKTLIIVRSSRISTMKH